VSKPGGVCSLRFKKCRKADISCCGLRNFVLFIFSVGAHNAPMASVKLNAVFNPETIQLMKASLEEAWDMLGPIEQPRQQASSGRANSPRRRPRRAPIPIRLRTWALVQAVPPTIAAPGIVEPGIGE